MASRRTPGVYGLLDDGFPSLDTPWHRIAEGDIVPTGPATDAGRFEVGVVGLETPSHEDVALGDADEGDEAEEYTPPDRYRSMEVQGHVVMVRCNPRWLEMGKQLAATEEVDPREEHAFFRMVKRRKPERRTEIASVLNPLFRSKNKDSIADELERLAHDS